MLKKLKFKISSLQLKYKLTLLILVALNIPIGIFAMIVFHNIEESITVDQIKSIEHELIKNNQTIIQNVEMCNMATQVIVNSQVLNDYLMRFKRGDNFDTKELLNFYKTEVNGVEKMVDSNPNLHQIRIYIHSDTMTEMMPLLYRYVRIKKTTWAQVRHIKSGTWTFDYEDQSFPRHALNVKKHMVSLVTALSNHEFGEYGILEVATTMQTMFPDIYESDQESWTCFVDENGRFYYDSSSELKWQVYLDEVFAEVDLDSKKSYYQKMTIGNEDIIMGYMPIKVLNGHLLKIVSLRSQQDEIIKYAYLFLLILLISLVLLVFLFSFFIKVILKPFYSITEVVHEVQKGNLEVRVQNSRKDEIGVLGNEINQMLDFIHQLIEESVNREILIKNSQILALQNQINSHFIYNVLESIKMMAEIDEKYAISDAVTSLGSLLRYSMRWNSQYVTVEEEVNYIKNYLALINLRFDYEIYLSINMPEEIWKQKIPKMSLQPIIENAIYHGIEDIAENTCLYMKGIIKDDSCMIKITDSGRGISSQKLAALQEQIDGKIENSCTSGNGIGLKNVQDRIRISFGENYGLRIFSKEGCYTQVAILIPFEKGGNNHEKDIDCGR